MRGTTFSKRSLPMPKSTKDVRKFIDVLEEAGYEPKSYSGRGMYGKQCVSVSGDREDGFSGWEIARALWFNNYDGEDDLDVPEPHQDSLGRGTVLYWPSYEWPKEDGA
ncbi:unnamed protein product [Sphagnum jensenii]